MHNYWKLLILYFSHHTDSSSFQNFKLAEDMKALFTVEVTEGRSKSKDHLAVIKGEQLSVFTTSHPKLPAGKLLVEKEDGTCEL